MNIPQFRDSLALEYSICEHDIGFEIHLHCNKKSQHCVSQKEKMKDSFNIFSLNLMSGPLSIWMRQKLNFKLLLWIKLIGLPWWLRWWRICLQCNRTGFEAWVRKIPWRRKWQPTPIFLPGKSHEQRSLAGYSPWDRKVSDMTTATNKITDENWLHSPGNVTPCSVVK